MEYIFIIIYLFIIIGLYIFIIERMKNISYRHMTNTGLKSLGRGYEVIRRRLIVTFTLLFFVSTYLFLTFIR